MAPILGELAFFLGIVQPLTVRTRPEGDVQLLVLSKDDSFVLFDSYPEQVMFFWQLVLSFRKSLVSEFNPGGTDGNNLRESSRKFWA